FRDVSFHHGGKPVLDRFNLQLDKGDFVCIAAASGKGKTTALNLLLGFLSPAAGDILINNQIASAAERTCWQSRIAYVKQQSFLIHDTIRRNITLSDDAGDEARLRYAVTHAGLRPFIDGFPEGIDRVVTDSGRNISGGQRQRI